MINISFDAASSDQASSVSHTAASDATIAIAYAFLNNNTGNMTATYDGVAMESIRLINNLTSGSKAQIWYILNPPTGAKTVSVSSTVDTVGMVGVITLKGDISGIGDDFATSTADLQATHSDTLNTTSRNAWAVYADASQYRNDAGHSSSTGTERWEEAVGTPIGAMYTAQLAQPGAHTLSVTCAQTTYHHLLGVEIKPKVSGGFLLGND